MVDDPSSVIEPTSAAEISNDAALTERLRASPTVPLGQHGNDRQLQPAQIHGCSVYGRGADLAVGLTAIRTFDPIGATAFQDGVFWRHRSFAAVGRGQIAGHSERGPGRRDTPSWGGC